MEPFDLSWAAQVMKAQLAGSDSGQVLNVCRDSRQAGPGTLFFALKGDKDDGHNHVASALAAGAAAVVSRLIKTDQADLKQLIVSDTLVALGDLAQSYRRKFQIPVVGITGSVGKTSTKEMLASVLRSKYTVLANEKNFNNEIGVPETLFALESRHQVAIVEMGMRAEGEIRRLAEIASPNIGVLTGIGHSHIEILGSRQAIASAKAELFEMLPRDGVAIIPDDIPYSDIVGSRIPAGCRVVRVGSPGSDVWATSLIGETRDGSGETFTVHIRDTGASAVIRLSAAGVHHKSNALLAIATGIELGVPLDDCVHALEEWRGAEGRMTVRNGANGALILDDCYNAGPESMQAALSTLAGYVNKNRVAVLGDMRELGTFGPELHADMAKHVLNASVRLLITVGDLAALVADSIEKGRTSGAKPEMLHFNSSEELAEHINAVVKPEDVVLVKGSRALHMEQVISKLTGQTEASSHA